MAIQRLRTLCLETFRTLHQLNPCFMSNLFEVKSSDRPVLSQQNQNLKAARVTIGKKSLKT